MKNVNVKEKITEKSEIFLQSLSRDSEKIRFSDLPVGVDGSYISHCDESRPFNFPSGFYTAFQK
jgi:hypothetical protein